VDTLQQLKVPFLDLKQQFVRLEREVHDAIWPLLKSASFIEGAPVAEFEKRFAQYCAVREAVALDSGTAALHLALLALNIGPGDEVICPSNTFIATAAAIVAAGARPVFVDSHPDHWQMDIARVEQAITSKCRAVIAVHLYGQPVEISEVKALCASKRLYLIEDAAQAHGARYNDGRVGSFGDISCFSFYPGKNLGAFGDGGAAVTNSSALAERMRRLRNHGRTTKYEHAEVGFNLRMDAVQAAVLNLKLPYLDEWNEQRRHWAALYREQLDAVSAIKLPNPIDRTEPVHHLFPVLTPDRDRLAQFLKGRGIETGVHYPIPLHLQPAFKHLDYKQGAFPVAERLGEHEISLPIFPEMTEEQVTWVCESIADFFAGKQTQ
jgi:dTDP-4-amino-4,6-dideoxygalactose transaminase